MVKFDLADAHPDYRREIPEILLPLTERYPGARLNSVSLYAPKPRDTSMGATFPGGRIKLNPFWFTREPVRLKDAAQRHPMIEVGGVEIGWHGKMVWEPRQVLTHEFGHVVWLSLPQPKVERWATERWRAATRDPNLAPSGYAMTDPDEFFGEMFALVHLGLATEDEEGDLMELIGELR